MNTMWEVTYKDFGYFDEDLPFATAVRMTITRHIQRAVKLGIMLGFL